MQISQVKFFEILKLQVLDFRTYYDRLNNSALIHVGRNDDGTFDVVKRIMKYNTN